MGPEQPCSSSNPTDPPIFDPKKDLQEWRKDISRLVDTVSAAARKGSDRLYKTTFANLAIQLYDSALPAAQKYIVDESQVKGIIDYRQDNQVEAVRQIVELIAVDPPIAVVSRLIASLNRVTNCSSRKDEYLASFVSRFRGLASDHLMHGVLSFSSQVGELFAITLLNNSSISEETLRNAKLQLIAMAEARMGKEQLSSSGRLVVDKAVFDASVQELDKMLSKPHLHLMKKDEHALTKGKLVYTRKRIAEVAKDLENLGKKSELETHRPHGEGLLKSAPHYRLNRDDAVTVMKNLSFTPGKSSRHISKSDLKNIVGREVQTALLAMSKQAEGSVSSRLGERNGKPTTSTSPKPRLSRKRNGGAKRKSKAVFCFDRGDPDHLPGNEACLTPSFLTKKRKLERQSQNQNKSQSSINRSQPRRATDNQPHNRPSDFRQGAGPSKRNHA